MKDKKSKDKKITIRDIAERLQIGKTAVALALSDKYGVSEETKARIVLTAHEMGYDFSKIRKKRNSITVVLKDKSFLTTEFWQDIIKGIEKEASDLGYVTEILALDKSNSLANVSLAFLQGNSIGLLFIDSYFDDNYDSLLKLRIPVVLIDPRNYMGADFTQIRADNFLGGFMACEYLWRHGHRRLCYIGNIAHGNSVRSRWLGFSERYSQLSRGAEGCSLCGITQADKADKDYMHNEAAVAEAFAGAERPSGIFCCNDMVALRTMEMLKKRYGFTAPRDYSIIGFDDILQSQSSDPPLTTFNVNREEMGRMAAAFLVEEVESKSLQKKDIQIYGMLVERASVGRNKQ